MQKKTKNENFQQSHSAEKSERRDPLGFFNIRSVAKYQKMKGGIFGDMVKGETRTHVLLLGRPQIILINLYAKCQKLRQVVEVGQLPEVATATNSDYATCGLKRESCRAEKSTRTFP